MNESTFFIRYYKVLATPNASSFPAENIDIQPAEISAFFSISPWSNQAAHVYHSLFHR